LAASPDEDQATAELRPSHQGRPAPGATKASIRQRPRTRNQRINPLTRALRTRLGATDLGHHRWPGRWPTRCERGHLDEANRSGHWRSTGTPRDSRLVAIRAAVQNISVVLRPTPLLGQLLVCDHVYTRHLRIAPGAESPPDGRLRPICQIHCGAAILDQEQSARRCPSPHSRLPSPHRREPCAGRREAARTCQRHQGCRDVRMGAERNRVPWMAIRNRKWATTGTPGQRSLP